jgi:hypothetical protein
MTTVDEPEPFDQHWLDKAKRRRDEVRSGQVQTIPGDEAIKKVRDILRQSEG